MGPTEFFLPMVPHVDFTNKLWVKSSSISSEDVVLKAPPFEATEDVERT